MRKLFPSSGSTGPSSETELEMVDGSVEHIVFQNEENGYCVARLDASDREAAVTVVGVMPGVQVGESVRLGGKWVNDSRFGDQFRVETFVPIRPSTLVGIRRYLQSGMVKGVGEVMAERIIDRFGIKTLDVLDHDPERLREVSGIGAQRVEKIRESWNAHNRIQQVMIFLQSHGVSAAFAVKIFSRYGNRAIERVQANPYRLAIDIEGIGFKTADEIATSLGVAKNAPKRIEAGSLHILGEMTSQGHVYVPREPLIVRAMEILEVADRGLVEESLDRLQRQEHIVIEPVADDIAVYTRQLHTFEAHAGERLSELVAHPVAPIAIDVPRAIDWFEKQQGIELGREQREALATVVRHKVVVITGGPGTGKTTLVNAVIRIFEKKVRAIELAAPTGRAAKRMTEATGRDARTLHRLLEFNPRTRSFGRDADNPLEGDLFIIDETSMVDIAMFCQLVQAIPFGGRLVLVGDVDQLPSVGPGRVLADVIDSGCIEIARLTEIYRQAAESLIITNAHRIHDGDMPHCRSGDDGGDFFFHECDDPDQALAVIKRLVSERIPARFGLRAIEDVQVLTPMHKGDLGATRLNQELQALLNPAADALVRGDRKFRVGDKVMQTQNNYDLDVFNGDIGRIALIEPAERKLSVSFDGRLVEYESASIDDLVHAYACTIHKSQGSEFPAVVIPLHTQHWVMLQRNLIYTAVTRGKRLVVVVGSQRALARAVRNQRENSRWSALAARIRGGGEIPEDATVVMEHPTDDMEESNG